MKNALLMCGILLFVLSTAASAATDSNIIEEFDNGDYSNKPAIDSGRVNGNETPVTMSGAVLGTGFTWGGLSTEMWEHKGAKIITKDNGAHDYAYTIFDDTGGNSANHTIDLTNGVIDAYISSADKDDTSTCGARIHYMVRTGVGNWYLSDSVMAVSEDDEPEHGGKKHLRLYGAVATWGAIGNTNGAVTSLDALTGSDEKELYRASSGLSPDLSLVDGVGYFLIDAGSGNKEKVTNFTMFMDSVPEPATIALLGLGGLFLRRRR